MATAPSLLAAPRLPEGSARFLTRADAPELQHFLDGNPEYFLAISDAKATSGTALEWIDHVPPVEFSFEHHFVIGLEDQGAALFGVALITQNLMAAGVWHIGLFLIASKLHGTGRGTRTYLALEAWVQDAGARFIRIGVVIGNHKAERFWQRQGYSEVRIREGVAMQQRVNREWVMVKALDAGGIDGYLALVERDRPG